MPTQTKDDSDSDSDVEFEDVLPQSNQNGSSHSTWTPTLILPNQRPRPVDPGSEDEIQLRGRLTSGIDRITYRQMKADMSMDAPNTPSTHRRYDSFKELAADLEGMVDMLWASATCKSSVPSPMYDKLTQNSINPGRRSHHTSWNPRNGT